MLFNSLGFIFIFLPLSCIAYFVLRALCLHRLALFSLLLASLIFYAFGDYTYAWLIVCSVLFNFVTGEQIRRTASTQKKKTWLFAGVAVDLLTLGVFKYANFLAATLAQCGLMSAPSWHISLPVGISFFTFTQIAYLVDVRRAAAHDYDPISYGLFVTFFPHLIAGPILHHKEMMPQFREKKAQHISSYLSSGVSVFALGLFKKAVLADAVAPAADLLFSQVHHGAPPNLIAAWTAALAYTVQIYFDFSGYSDMAIGLARMLGIDLPINFNSPYKATSIVDFWRRWHITLSRFLRDYLYIPLGGNRQGPLRRYANLIVTMLLGGIWHGAGWTFAVWGLLHGLFLTTNHVWRKITADFSFRCPKLVGQFITFVAVVFAWVPFRAPDMKTAFAIWRGMFGFGGIAIPSNWPLGSSLATHLGFRILDLGVNGSTAAMILLLIVASMVLPNSQQIFAPASIGLDSPGYDAKPIAPNRLALRFWKTPLAALTFGLILGIAIRAIGGYSAFIYFQF